MIFVTGDSEMVDKSRLAAVIPAAGLSSRMGAFKPLLPVGDKTMIEASVCSALSCADRAVVVLGWRGEEIREKLSERFAGRLIFTENPDYASTDMIRSVRIALEAIGSCDAFFIAPADMPMISPAVYRLLAASFTEDDGILIPVTDDKRGHPPLISSRLIPDILAYDGTEGLRGFYRTRKVRQFAVDDTGILKDADTPEDYRNLISNKATKR